MSKFQISPHIPIIIEKSRDEQQNDVPNRKQVNILINIEQDILVNKEPQVVSKPFIAIPSFYKPLRNFS